MTGAFYTVFPIIEVQSRFLFAAKIIVVVIIANAIGAGIYALDNHITRLKDDHPRDACVGDTPPGDACLWDAPWEMPTCEMQA